MSPNQSSPHPSGQRDRILLLQELRETRERARLGGFFYPIATALAFAVTSRQYFVHAVTITAFFVLLAVARLLVRMPAGTDDRGVRRGLIRIWGLILLTAIGWGAFSAWSYLSLPDPGPLVAVLFSGAFGMALAHSMCMRRIPSMIAIAAVMLPSLILLGFRVAPGVAVMWAVYLVYMLLVVMRSYREYRQRLELEADLREQRDRFERQSQVDGLTGLFNRRAFAAALEEALADARDGGTASLLILDVDHFKHVNDSQGHLAGDACLLAMAQCLQRHFDHPDDVVARLGGEEFGVVLRDAADSAHERAERFRLDLDSSPLVFVGGQAEITVSIGCGTFEPTRHSDADALYGEVDAALYRSKLAGRNRTERIDGAAAIPADRMPAG